MAIKVAVIGCGYWGPNLIRNFSQLEESELVYCCDLSQKKLMAMKKIHPYVKITANYKDILNDPDVDAVAIATPIATHFTIAKDALLSGKHVFVEKPITGSSKEAEELITISNKKNKVLMVDHVFEYAQAVNKMKELINKGEIGKIHYIRAEWLNLGLLQPDMNVVWDLATHISSIIYYLIGKKPISLSAKAGAYIRSNIEEVAHITLKFPDNVLVYMNVSWLEPAKTRKITIVGNKKMMVYDLMNPEEQIKIYDKGVELNKDENDLNQYRINYRYGDIYSPNLRTIEPLKEACLDFINSIKNKTKPRSNGEVGLEIVKILEAAEESVRNGGKEIKI